MASLASTLVFEAVLIYVVIFRDERPVSIGALISGYVVLALGAVAIPLVAHAAVKKPVQFIFSESGIEQLFSFPLWSRAKPVSLRWEDVGGVSEHIGKAITRLHIHHKDGSIVMTIVPTYLGMKSLRMREMIFHHRRFVGGLPPGWISPPTKDRINRFNTICLLVVAGLIVVLVFLK